MYRLVIFDLDGTLIDSAHDVSSAIIFAANSVCELPAASAVTFEQTAPLLGKDLRTTFAALLPPQYHALIPTCIEAYRTHYVANCDRVTRPFPGMLELVGDLKAQGYKLAIATTKISSTALTVATRLNLLPYFDLVQGVENFPSKPDPFILKVVMQKLEVSPAETLMVGDTDNDVLCAQAAKVAVCGVTWGAWTAAQLAELHPNFIIKNVNELRQIILA